MKAYDSVSWEFLINVLTVLNTPAQVINWIKACICSPKFSISINGTLEGYFHGQRGLRQGDPLSPYLFVIAMEVFSRMLNKAADDPSFKYHSRCEKIKLTHLCFADDLLVFSHGSEGSISIINHVLVEFEHISGLKANLGKSVVFFSGVNDVAKHAIFQILNFSEDKLPVRYLGVPFITKKLSIGDCQPLIDRIAKRVHSWSWKHLSYAGRL